MGCLELSSALCTKPNLDLSLQTHEMGELGLRMCSDLGGHSHTGQIIERLKELNFKGLDTEDSDGKQEPRLYSYLPPASFSISQIRPRLPVRHSLPPLPARDPGRAELRLTHHGPQPAALASGPRPAARPSPPSCAGASPGARKAAPRDWSQGNLGNGVRPRSYTSRGRRRQLALL